MPGEVDETGFVGLVEVALVNDVGLPLEPVEETDEVGLPLVELAQEPVWPLVVRPLVEVEVTEPVGLEPVELVQDVGLPLVELTDVGGLVLVPTE